MEPQLKMIAEFVITMKLMTIQPVLKIVLVFGVEVLSMTVLEFVKEA